MATERRTILVFGATGKQGGACIDALLAHSDRFHLRTFTRKPDAPLARRLAERGVEVVKGDLNDAETVKEAVKGAYGVFLATEFVPFGDDKLELNQGMRVVDIAFEQGVKYFVFTSVAGADLEYGRMLAARENKYQIEQHLRTKSWPDGWAVIRPDSFMENVEFMGPVSRGTVSTVFPDGHKIPWISVRDIGVFAAMAFTKPDEFRGRCTELAAEALTGSELAQVLSELTGEHWRYSQGVPSWVLRVFLRSMAPMLDYVAAGGANSRHDYARLRALHPGLETFRAWCRRRGLARESERPAGVAAYAYARTWAQRALGWTGLL